MDRLSWSDGSLDLGEDFILQQNGIRLYDGDDKTSFDNGIAVLTTHRLLWKDPRDPNCTISLPLSLVVYSEEQPSGFAKSAKIVLHLKSALANKGPGPVARSGNNYIRLSFRQAGQVEFLRCLNEEVSSRKWEKAIPSPTKPVVGGRQVRTGITGIQRNIELKNKTTDQNISLAFEDLSKLIDKAKDMVNLSKSIAEKIRDKKGDVTEDETVKFKSYLLSMGIPDPVTRETHGTGDKYYKELAKQISKVLEQPIKDVGGMMTLTDAYCRVNRARGMELLSPEDLVNACRQLEILKMPIRLRVFDSGVMVLQLQSHSEEEVIKSSAKMVDENSSLTAEELSQIVGISVILAKERLLVTEKAGEVCRDESVEGLRFYPNWFKTKSV